MIKVRLREVIDSYQSRTGERISYARLAALTGLSQRTLESIASRPTYNTTLATIEKLCVALECQPGDLLALHREQADGNKH